MCLFATQKGLEVLSKTLDSGKISALGCVITFKEKIAISFESEIERLCATHKIPFFFWEDVKHSIETLIAEYKISSIIAIGWRFLLPSSLNDVLKYPIIVFHDSLLPKYRGFAPTPTAIICGDESVGATALFASNEVDQGDTIWQKEIPITPDDYIQEVIDKQSVAYFEGFLNILEQMNTGAITSWPQDESQATYSIWRSPEDCKIDWSKPTKEIYNLIRAVGMPYPGAFTHYKNEKIIILRASMMPDLPFVIRDYGKVWSIKNNYPVIICGSGMLQIDSAVNLNGEPVLFDALRQKMQ